MSLNPIMIIKDPGIIIMYSADVSDACKISVTNAIEEDLIINPDDVLTVECTGTESTFLF